MTKVNHRLREAAEEGDEELIKTLLLKPQCNPKDADRKGETALINAAAQGHTSCVKLLLTVSDTLAKDHDGCSALMWAAWYGHALCVELLLPVSDALTTDNTGWSALMWAASNGYTSCVQLLLPVSDGSARNSQNKTASELATERGYPELGSLIDAYALSVKERGLIDASTASANGRRPRSLRV